MTERSEMLAAILEEKYGITSMRELEAAIRTECVIDISVFCEEPSSVNKNKRKGADNV